MSREASHAGSWYSDNQRVLTRQLDQWLGQVGDEGPVPGARVVIAPYVPTEGWTGELDWTNRLDRHAGYSYSGACAAHAYRALDLSKA